jgi:metal-responsive CopG/Arc/MetJ family transcriptional regulator
MPKTKVSVTIERSVLERLDRVSAGMSRSEIVERALRSWLNAQRRLELEDEIAAYYLERQPEESTEDRNWAALSAAQIRKTWR